MSGLWIAVVRLAGAGAAVLVTFRPRVEAAVASVVLVASALTAWVLPFGK